MSKAGHPARDSFAAEVRELGLVLLAAQEDDTMVQHGTAALWVSGHGRVFTRHDGPLPGGIAAGEHGKCFANAQQAARDHGLRYAEGFAGPSAAGRWTLHAWNADSRRRVIDPTWPDGPAANGHYLGIEFDDLPEGELAGISLLADLLGGKLVGLDNKTGRVTVTDGHGELAEMVKANGGTIFLGRTAP